MLSPRRGLILISCGLIAYALYFVHVHGASEPPIRSGLALQDDIHGGTSVVGGSVRGQNEAISLGSASLIAADFGRTDNFTRHIVVAKMKDEDASWLTPSNLDGAIPKIYIPDDPTAPLHVPRNKGHEVMVYLSYIIDHYEQLPDVAVFMHAHRQSWHQGGLLQYDAVETIQRLSSARVTRQGYMNLRCEWNPGCPAWMHPGKVNDVTRKIEEPAMAKAFGELFPGEPIPEVIAQPCCAQFALSKDRILSLPKPRYEGYRDWLLQTPLVDEISGRIFEYLWQYIFTGNATFCPDMHQCYCDGYGLCFEDDAKFDYWFQIRWERHLTEKQLEEWKINVAKLDRYRDKDGLLIGIEAEDLVVPEAGLGTDLAGRIESSQKRLDQERLLAIERGKDPKVRARVAGRAWKEGDGF